MRSTFPNPLPGLPVLALAVSVLIPATSPLNAAGEDRAAQQDQPRKSPPEKVVRIRPKGEGRFAGRTGEPIREALKELRATGGTILIEPGEYLVRERLTLPDDIVLRGTDTADATVLRFPKPTATTADAAKGDRAFSVANPAPFAPDTTVQILPPEGTEAFEALEGETRSGTIESTAIASIEGDRITLAEPLPVDLPEGSRIGYAHNLISMREPTENVTIENLTLEGGRTDLPMPGHAKRCAVWADSPYTYADGPQAPPISGLRVRHCIIRDFYGRAVAMYNVVDSEVIGCRIARIPDDAINFDHFNYRNRAEGNIVLDARHGVTLNDASECTVRYNRLVRCGSGIHVWWWHKVDPEGVNERNTITHNTILAPDNAAISLSEHAVRNTVRYNFVGGPVRVEEDANTVEHNTRLPPDADGS